MSPNQFTLLTRAESRVFGVFARVFASPFSKADAQGTLSRLYLTFHNKCFKWIVLALAVIFRYPVRLYSKVMNISKLQFVLEGLNSSPHPLPVELSR